MSYPSVKVVFVCPENPAHILGAVGRQVHAIPGSPAGREVIADENGLRTEHGPHGELKLVGCCRTCSAAGSRRSTQLRWARVAALLDEAEDAQAGVLRYTLND